MRKQGCRGAQKQDKRSKARREKRTGRGLVLLVAVIVLALFLSGCTAIDPDAETDDGAGPIGQLLGSRSQSLQIVGILTILSLAPSMLVMFTGFVRIIIVFSFIRNAMGMQQMPPNQVIIVLALFLAFFVMTPVFAEINETALEPYINGEITFDEAVDVAEVPIKDFMLRNTRTTDLNLFINLSGQDPPAEPMDTPLSTVIPAFLTSEIKTGFMIGFLIYIPFIVIDMVVASTLMTMGMMMLPPVVISLPFKVLIFIMVDGWGLTMQNLVVGFY